MAASTPVAEVATAARRFKICARLKATMSRLRSLESKTSLRLILRTCLQLARYQNRPDEAAPTMMAISRAINKGNPVGVLC